jgi:hypothetical protein
MVCSLQTVAEPKVVALQAVAFSVVVVFVPVPMPLPTIARSSPGARLVPVVVVVYRIPNFAARLPTLSISIGA